MPEVWPYWVGTDCGTQVYPPTATSAWNLWVSAQVTTSPQVYAAGVWQGWVNQGEMAALANSAWVQWQTASTNICLPQQLYGAAAPYRAPEPTPEQRVQQRRTALILRNRQRTYQLRRNIAARKAEQLLLEHLDAEQREEWRAARAFTVHTADGKRAYRIAYGLAGNVRLVKADEAPVSKYGHALRVGARFCMHVYHPDGPVPNEDNVLAQKLLIESNERHFLDLANVS